jgi:hypothetical protein
MWIKCRDARSINLRAQRPKEQTMNRAIDMFSLQGRTALVTYVNFSCLAMMSNQSGGNRGIGSDIAIGLAEAGADVVLIQVRFEGASN